MRKKNNSTINWTYIYIKWKNSSIENLFFSKHIGSDCTQKTFFLWKKKSQTSRGQKSSSITFIRFFLFFPITQALLFLGLLSVLTETPKVSKLLKISFFSFLWLKFYFIFLLIPNHKVYWKNSLFYFINWFILWKINQQLQTSFVVRFEFFSDIILLVFQPFIESFKIKSSIYYESL